MGLNRRQRMAVAPQDRDEWQRLYYHHQNFYFRRRLNAVRLIWDGLKLVDVCIAVNCDIKSLRKWIDAYLSGGFKQLLASKVSGKRGKGKLSKDQLRVLKYIILKKTPLDYAMDFYRWTLDAIKNLIATKWQVELKKSQIQVILKQKLGLSYQKFHRDYANADINKQKSFAKDLSQRIENKSEDEVQIWFDEFSISTRPDASYGWARVNTHPTIPSNEKKEKDTMDF